MILLDKKTVLEIMNPPDTATLADWLKQNRFSVGAVAPEDDYTGSYTLTVALYYAGTKHPNAEMMDICSFAGLVQYFSSGFSGGFGTDEYKKERIIDNIIMTMAGGTPAHPDEIISYIPADLATGTRTPTPEETEDRISLMDELYFGDMTDAITSIIETVTPEQAARIVLAMAQTNAEYKEILSVAKKFLARKASIGELRQTVKRVSEQLTN